MSPSLSLSFALSLALLLLSSWRDCLLVRPIWLRESAKFKMIEEGKLLHHLDLSCALPHVNSTMLCIKCLLDLSILQESSISSSNELGFLKWRLGSFLLGGCFFLKKSLVISIRMKRWPRGERKEAKAWFPKVRPPPPPRKRLTRQCKRSFQQGLSYVLSQWF